MAFFDKLGKKLEGMVQDAQEYTSDFIEINRLNGAIRTEREAIDSLQRNIGATLHRRYQAGDSVPEEIRTDLDEITQRLEKIAGLETRIEEAKRTGREARPAADEPEAGGTAVPFAADQEVRTTDAEPEPAMTMELDETGPVEPMPDRPWAGGEAPMRTDEPMRPDGPMREDEPIREDETLMGRTATTEADLVNQQAATPIQPVEGGVPEQPAEQRRRFCTNCGSPLMPGKPFCGNCGQRND